jgi:hypothetical protein
MTPGMSKNLFQNGGFVFREVGVAMVHSNETEAYNGNVAMVFQGLFLVAKDLTVKCRLFRLKREWDVMNG